MTDVPPIENVPAGSEGAAASTPAITFMGWKVLVEWVAIKKLKAKTIALNGISCDELSDLMSGANSEFGFTSGQVFVDVDDKVVFELKMNGDELTKIGDHKTYDAGDHKTYYLVTEEAIKGCWKVEERTSQAFERSKLSLSPSTIALNGFEFESTFDLTYDDQCFDNDWLRSKWQDAYLLDPTGRRIDFDIIDTDPQAELI